MSAEEQKSRRAEEQAPFAGKPPQTSRLCCALVLPRFFASSLLRFCASALVAVSILLLVDAAAAGDIHLPHKDVKRGCAACHVEATRDGACGPVPGGWKKIGHDTCVPCHAEFSAKPLPGGDALKKTICLPCHPAPPARSGVSADRPGVVFGHAVHKGTGGPCRSCHEVREGAMATSVSMHACVSCHEQEGRRISCATCHPPRAQAAGAADDAAVPAAEPRPALRSLLPMTGMPGLGHGPGWAQSHGKAAVARAATCRECHDDRKCASCHVGTSRRLVFHPADWTAVHGIAAKKKSSDCGACHAYTRFCIGCHQRTGAASGGGARAQTRTAHPAGWGSTVLTPSHHSFAAQKDISSCASCHEEGSCTRCHATAAKGGRGRNPHSAGFAADCGSYLSRNEDACLKCHERSDLKKKCLPGVRILPPK